MEHPDRWRIIAVGDKPFLALTIRTSFADKFSLKAVTGWIKSSVLLWYSDCALGSTNLWKPSVLRNIPIPVIPAFEHGGRAEKLISEIIKRETDFLTVNDINFLSSVEPKSDDSKKFLALLNTHNSTIAKLAAELDMVIFEELQIDEPSIAMVKEHIDITHFFNVLSNTKQCYDEVAATIDIREKADNNIQRN